jgi:hypothetical protein
MNATILWFCSSYSMFFISCLPHETQVLGLSINDVCHSLQWDCLGNLHHDRSPPSVISSHVLIWLLSRFFHKSAAWEFWRLLCQEVLIWLLYLVNCLFVFLLSHRNFCFQFDLREEKSTKLLTCHQFRSSSGKPSRTRVVRLNAIVMNPRNFNYFAVGVSDQYARVYDIRRVTANRFEMEDQPSMLCYAPKHLQGPGKSLVANNPTW